MQSRAYSIPEHALRGGWYDLAVDLRMQAQHARLRCSCMSTTAWVPRMAAVRKCPHSLPDLSTALQSILPQTTQYSRAVAYAELHKHFPSAAVLPSPAGGQERLLAIVQKQQGSL